MAATKTSCSSAILAAESADPALIASRFSQALLKDILGANGNFYPK